MIPASIRPRVSAATITKVTRLFNGTPADIIAELFQNARRAGASLIRAEIVEEQGKWTLTVSDDGVGIADPQALVTLGASGWEARTVEAEDPAGMGVFSLAGHDVVIRSRTAEAEQGWEVRIPPHGWEGAVELGVEPVEAARGTAISVAIDADFALHAAREIPHAARFLPIPVEFEGQRCEQAHFLAGAIHVVYWRGARIGMFEGHVRDIEPCINFHGLVVRAALPKVAEVEAGRGFHARVDIGARPAIQLVLPARKEPVRNQAFADLCVAVERALYDVVGGLGPHRLGHAQWLRAGALGVTLPEAAALLECWHPPVADIWAGCTPKLVDARDAVIIGAMEPPIAQPLARALNKSPTGLQFCAEKPAYVGYAWYDAMSRLTEPQFRVRHGDEETLICEANSLPAMASHLKADSIDAEFEIVGADGVLPFRISTDVAFGTDANAWDGLEAARVAWVEAESLTAGDLVDLLDAAWFCASDDAECDSYDSQRRYFEDEAHELAVELMHGRDAAICDQVRRLLDTHRWLLPQGRSLRILASKDRVKVEFTKAETPA